MVAEQAIQCGFCTPGIVIGGAALLARVTSLWRKIKEVPYSMAMEAKYTKDEILTIYISRAYLGAGTRGFEAAAQRYFGKSAAEVTPAEAAMLAGLLKAPSRYSPTTNPDKAAAVAEKPQAIGWFVGQVMKATGGKANPAAVNDILKAKLGL